MELKTVNSEQAIQPASAMMPKTGSVCVLWIDWYAYHVARFRALCESPELHGRVAGVEMVGGTGVHRGLKFRESIPADLPVTTLFSDGSWNDLGKWAIARAVWRYLNHTRPDTIFVPGYYNLPALTAALWGRVHRKKSVLMTESTEGDHQRNFWQERFKSLLIRGLFQWAIAGGAAHIRYLRKLGVAPARIGRYYDVINNRFFREQAARDRQRNSARDFRLPEKYFLFVGRLAEEKNVVGLLEAYKAYRQSGGSWSLVLVGDGPLRHKLKTLADESGYQNNIFFEGLKTSGELSPYYAFAGAFVLPSSREPWGLVVNEAMASGLPVAITLECGCAEDLVIEGKNGFTFAAADRQALIQHLHTFERLSEKQRETMGNNSSEIISHYSPEGWAAEVARIVNA